MMYYLLYWQGALARGLLTTASTEMLRSLADIHTPVRPFDVTPEEITAMKL
jgi:hypothetical protein